MMLQSKSTNECLRQSPLLQGPFSKHLLYCRTSLVRKCQGQIMGFAELRLLGKSCLLQDLRDPICLHVLRLAYFISSTSLLPWHKVSGLGNGAELSRINILHPQFLPTLKLSIIPQLETREMFSQSLIGRKRKQTEKTKSLPYTQTQLPRGFLGPWAGCQPHRKTHCCQLSPACPQPLLTPRAANPSNPVPSLPALLSNQCFPL